MRIPLGNWGLTPIDPDREQAQQWAREELANGRYQQARPNVFSRALDWIIERIPDFNSDGSGFIGTKIGWVLLLLLAAIVIGVVLLHTGRLRVPSRSPQTATLFTEEVRTAAALRLLAQQAAARADWHAACCEQFRAIIRSLEERTILPKRPGQTAAEAAHFAAVQFPDHTTDLLAGARIFADLRYGNRPARAEYFPQLQALDQNLSKATSRPVRQPEPAKIP